MNRDLSPHRKYTGPCAFLKADPDFYVKSGIIADHVHHPDGVYGWSLPLSCPGIEPIPLACGHLDIFKDGEAVSKVASAIYPYSTLSVNHGLRAPIRNPKLPSRTKRKESRTRSGVIEHVRAKIGVVEFLLSVRLLNE